MKLLRILLSNTDKISRQSDSPGRAAEQGEKTSLFIFVVTQMIVTLLLLVGQWLMPMVNGSVIFFPPSV